MAARGAERIHRIKTERSLERWWDEGIKAEALKLAGVAEQAGWWDPQLQVAGPALTTNATTTGRRTHHGGVCV